ncbi:MAG: hypothetical protein Q9219_006003 [cf. Caloplaca sp. 3 TL-2023]
MRTFSVSAVLALGLAVHQVAATSNGLGFDDHANGDLGSYGDLKWKNVQCTNGLSKRTFDGQGGKSPSGGSKDFAPGMSIDTMHISSSEDTDLELHYGYENGQTCKQTASCSKGGSIIKNSQCGGAKTVIVKLPDTDTKSKCEVGIHSVNFNCGPASSKPPVPSSTSVFSSSIITTAQETAPYPIPTVNTTSSAGPTAPVPTPETTPISSTFIQTGSVPTFSTTVPQASNTSVYSTSLYSTAESTAPIETTPIETTSIISTTENSPSTPATTPATSTLPVVTTEIVITTLTTCPVTSTLTSGTTTSVQTTSTVSTLYITSTSTVCTQCVPPASTPAVSTAPEIPVTTNAIPVPGSTSNSPESPIPSLPPPVPTTIQAVVTTQVTSVEVVTTVSTITSTSISTICTQCVPPPPPATGTPVPPAVTGSSTLPLLVPTPSPSTGSSPVEQTSLPAPPCPTVLPNCMKTWITLTTCKDNSDSNCYCQDAGFTKTVQECVSAWSATGDDVQGALSYLAGICAPHVSQNPGIITNVPKTITLVPTPPPAASTGVQPPLPASPPPATPAPVGNSPLGVTSAPVVAGTLGSSPVGANSPPPAAPVTTLTLSQTVTYDCPVSQLADGQPQAPASSSCTSLLNTQVTVPQVGFTTAPAAPGSSSPSVGLAAGSPAPVPATPTPGSGGNSPVGATTFGTVVGSASAIGSNKPPGSTGSVPFIGAASNTKVTGFGILVGAIAALFVA